jgi:hypothetical protein
MARIPGGEFDGTNYQADLVIPEGKYPAEMIWSDFKRNSADTGDVLHFRFRIISGRFKGVEIYQTLNYTNPSTTAENIGRTLLESMRAAAGLTGRFEDTALLHNKPMTISVGIQAAQGLYPERNTIGSCSPYDASLATAASPAASSSATKASSPASSKPNWLKKEEAKEQPEQFDSPVEDEDIPV